MAVHHVQVVVVAVSERRACRVLSQPRGTPRYRPLILEAEARLGRRHRAAGDAR